MTSLEQGLAGHFSAAQLKKLNAATIAILGCGGLGSNLAFMLARSGVRAFRLIDPDRVTASNLNRQAFFPCDVGLAKVQALSQGLLHLEPGLELERLEERLTAENCKDLVFGRHRTGAVIVAEAVDSAAAKAMLFEKIRPLAAFYVTASGLAGLGGPAAPMTTRRIGKNAMLVGDGKSGIESGLPVLAPRVIEAAALQAGAILRHILDA